MRKKILYIAETLDGYIADLNDGISFLSPYDGFESISKSYEKLLSRIDTLIMGKKTFQVIEKMGEWPYQQMDSYILTSKPKPDLENIFFRSNIKELMGELDQKDGKDIWVVGGGLLIESMLNLGLIDEFQIAIVPKLIGSGKPLFPTGNYDLNLELVNIDNLEGLVLLTYIKK